MSHIETHAIARGYAEILSADGATALLRLHAAAEGDEIGEERLYYAVSQNDEVVFVSEESSSAAERFNRLTTGHASDTGHGGPQAGSSITGGGREDFLATMPTHLPTIRGPAFHKLAAQVSKLSHDGATEH